ncbi:MAG: hypothetical protein ACTSWR_08230 [Candidatus Helarchaeota archaeon]
MEKYNSRKRYEKEWYDVAFSLGFFATSIPLLIDFYYRHGKAFSEALDRITDINTWRPKFVRKRLRELKLRFKSRKSYLSIRFDEQHLMFGKYAPGIFQVMHEQVSRFSPLDVEAYKTYTRILNNTKANISIMHRSDLERLKSAIKSFDNYFITYLGVSETDVLKKKSRILSKVLNTRITSNYIHIYEEKLFTDPTFIKLAVKYRKKIETLMLEAKFYIKSYGLTNKEREIIKSMFLDGLKIKYSSNKGLLKALYRYRRKKLPHYGRIRRLGFINIFKSLEKMQFGTKLNFINPYLDFIRTPQSFIGPNDEEYLKLSKDSKFFPEQQNIMKMAQKLRTRLREYGLKDAKMETRVVDVGNGSHAIIINIFHNGQKFPIYVPLPNEYGVIKEYKYGLLPRQSITHIYKAPGKKPQYISQKIMGRYMEYFDRLIGHIKDGNVEGFAHAMNKIYSRVQNELVPILQLPGAQISNWNLKMYSPLSMVMYAIEAVRMGTHKKVPAIGYQVNQVKSWLVALDLYKQKNIKQLSHNLKIGNMQLKDITQLDNVIFLDTETTGLHLDSNIWSITALRFDNGKLNVVNEFKDVGVNKNSVWYQTRYRTLQNEGLDHKTILNIIKREQRALKGKTFDPLAIQKLAEFIEKKDDVVIIGSNVTFDIEKILESRDPALNPLKKVLIKKKVKALSVDGVYKVNMGLSTHMSNLSFLMKKFDISDNAIYKFIQKFYGKPTNITRHTSLYDTVATLLVFAKMMGKEEFTGNMEQVLSWFESGRAGTLKWMLTNLIGNTNINIYENDWDYILPLLKAKNYALFTDLGIEFPGQIGKFDASVFWNLMASINQDKLARGVVPLGPYTTYDMMTLHTGANYAKELRQLANVVQFHTLPTYFAGSFGQFKKWVQEFAALNVKELIGLKLSVKRFKEIFRYLPIFLPHDHPMQKVAMNYPVFHNAIVQISRFATTLDEAQAIGNIFYRLTDDKKSGVNILTYYNSHVFELPNTTGAKRELESLLKKYYAKRDKGELLTLKPGRFYLRFPDHTGNLGYNSKSYTQAITNIKVVELPNKRIRVTVFLRGMPELGGEKIVSALTKATVFYRQIGPTINGMKPKEYYLLYEWDIINRSKNLKMVDKITKFENILIKYGYNKKARDRIMGAIFDSKNKIPIQETLAMSTKGMAPEFIVNPRNMPNAMLEGMLRKIMLFNHVFEQTEALKATRLADAEVVTKILTKTLDLQFSPARLADPYGGLGLYTASKYTDAAIYRLFKSKTGVRLLNRIINKEIIKTQFRSLSPEFRDGLILLKNVFNNQLSEAAKEAGLEGPIKMLTYLNVLHKGANLIYSKNDIETFRRYGITSSDIYEMFAQTYGLRYKRGVFYRTLNTPAGKKLEKLQESRLIKQLLELSEGNARFWTPDVDKANRILAEAEVLGGMTPELHQRLKSCIAMHVVIPIGYQETHPTEKLKITNLNDVFKGFDTFFKDAIKFHPNTLDYVDSLATVLSSKFTPIGLTQFFRMRPGSHSDKIRLFQSQIYGFFGIGKPNRIINQDILKVDLKQLTKIDKQFLTKLITEEPELFLDEYEVDQKFLFKVLDILARKRPGDKIDLKKIKRKVRLKLKKGKAGSNVETTFLLDFPYKYINYYRLNKSSPYLGWSIDFTPFFVETNKELLKKKPELYKALNELRDSITELRIKHAEKTLTKNPILKGIYDREILSQIKDQFKLEIVLPFFEKGHGQGLFLSMIEDEHQYMVNKPLKYTHRLLTYLSAFGQLVQEPDLMTDKKTALTLVHKITNLIARIYEEMDIFMAGKTGFKREFFETYYLPGIKSQVHAFAPETFPSYFSKIGLTTMDEIGEVVFKWSKSNRVEVWKNIYYQALTYFTDGNSKSMEILSKLQSATGRKFIQATKKLRNVNIFNGIKTKIHFYNWLKQKKMKFKDLVKKTRVKSKKASKIFKDYFEQIYLESDKPFRIAHLNNEAGREAIKNAFVRRMQRFFRNDKNDIFFKDVSADSLQWAIKNAYVEAYADAIMSHGALPMLMIRNPDIEPTSIEPVMVRFMRAKFGEPAGLYVLPALHVFFNQDYDGDNAFVANVVGLKAAWNTYVLSKQKYKSDIYKQRILLNKDALRTGKHKVLAYLNSVKNDEDIKKYADLYADIFRDLPWGIHDCGDGTKLIYGIRPVIREDGVIIDVKWDPHSTFRTADHKQFREIMKQMILSDEGLRVLGVHKKNKERVRKFISYLGEEGFMPELKTDSFLSNLKAYEDYHKTFNMFFTDLKTLGKERIEDLQKFMNIFQTDPKTLFEEGSTEFNQMKELFGEGYIRFVSKWKKDELFKKAIEKGEAQSAMMRITGLVSTKTTIGALQPNAHFLNRVAFLLINSRHTKYTLTLDEYHAITNTLTGTTGFLQSVLSMKYGYVPPKTLTQLLENFGEFVSPYTKSKQRQFAHKKLKSLIHEVYKQDIMRRAELGGIQISAIELEKMIKAQTKDTLSAVDKSFLAINAIFSDRSFRELQKLHPGIKRQELRELYAEMHKNFMTQLYQINPKSGVHDFVLDQMISEHLFDGKNPADIKHMLITDKNFKVNYISKGLALHAKYRFSQKLATKLMVGHDYYQNFAAFARKQSTFTEDLFHVKNVWKLAEKSKFAKGSLMAIGILAAITFFHPNLLENSLRYQMTGIGGEAFDYAPIRQELPFGIPLNIPYYKAPQRIHIQRYPYEDYHKKLKDRMIPQKFSMVSYFDDVADTMRIFMPSQPMLVSKVDKSHRMTYVEPMARSRRV